MSEHPSYVSYKAVQKIIKEHGRAADPLAMIRVFIGMTGDHIAALMLNQLVYWSDKGKSNDGWFYKTAKEWDNELGLSYFQLKQAGKKITSLGLETKNRHVNNKPTLHYRLHPEAFYAALFEYLQIQETLNSRNSKLENLQIEETEISKLEKLELVNSRNSKNIIKETKTTTKNTTETSNTADAVQPDAPLTFTSKKASTNGSTNSRVKVKSPPDARARHPAIQAVREILGRFPDKLVWDDIIAAVGEQPDEVKLKRCAKAWARKTTNMGNLDVWLFEWYVKREPGQTNAKQHDPTLGAL